jgi:type VI secretion system secreted protein Hcp
MASMITHKHVTPEHSSTGFLDPLLDPPFLTRRRKATKVLAPTLTSIAILLTAMLPSTAVGADTVFLKLDNIEGESTATGHAKEIVLLSYTQSFTRAGGGGGVATGKADCGAITVTKLLDRSSPALIGAVLSGQVIPNGVITFRKEGNQPLEYYKVTLTDVLIQSISQTDASPTDPTTILEQISMSAGRFKFEYVTQAPTGAAQGGVTFSWDCLANRQG